MGMIDDPDRWVAAVERRNIMSHTYDMAVFRMLVAEAGVAFLPMMSNLRRLLERDRDE